MTEARTGKRFPLQLPITLFAQSSRKLRGTTSNVSAAGVYLHSERALAVGTAVRFAITLPGGEIGAKRDVAIDCAGRVVRSEPGSKGNGQGLGGLACVIDRYQIRR